MSKPREFWITLNRCALPDIVTRTWDDLMDVIRPNDDYYHVIEYSAYYQAIKERDSYKAKAEKLTEALELLRGHNQNNRAFGMYEIKVDSWIKKAIKEHGVSE